MNELYTRLFAVPNNLYTTGAPAIISAGALLKNNQTNTVLAHLKLKNIGIFKIKAVTVNIFPLDAVGKPLGAVITNQYLDLQLTRDEQFGEQVPIQLPDNSTRSFNVSISEVVFSNNTLWQASGEAWESLSVQESLFSILNKHELVEQYKLTYGSRCEFVQKEEKDLWHCTCGAINHDDEAYCHVCFLELSSPRPVDFEALTVAMEQRRDEEAQARKIAEEKHSADLKKRKKIAIIAGLIIVVGIISVIIYVNFIAPPMKYSKAMELMETEQYYEAGEAFAALGDYKDSSEMSAESYYQEAISLTEHGDTLLANALFLMLPDYKDANEYIGEMNRRELYAFYGNLIATGDYHAVGLKADGTVVAGGLDEFGALETDDWTDIVAISAGSGHTVGLKRDGSVLTVGDKLGGALETDDWNLFE